jgi:DNA-binding MarR family transcriptional regulator
MSGGFPIDRRLTIGQSPTMTRISTAGRTHRAEVATRIVLSTFRANGLFLAAGDELAAREGLTSARWQVLGAVELAERALTVPQIARRMGLARQSVHATVRNLVDDGLLEFVANADHRRSPLVTTTVRGKQAYRALDAHQAVWVNELAAGLDETDLEIAARVIDALCLRLDPIKADATGTRL